MSDNEYVTNTNCEDRRTPMCKDIESLHKTLEKLSSKMNWFYILAIGTLIGVIVDLLKAKG